MTTYPVKWIDSRMHGAPVICGQAGKFNAALKALLITGWGAKTPTTVSVASGVGTAVFSSGNFLQHSIILISGATDPALNGEARVLTSNADTNTITFETTAANTGSAGGGITIKYAPQGSWAEVFVSGNTSVMRSADPLGSRMYYRFNDTAAQSVRVIGYTAMTNVNTGSNPFPTNAQSSGGVWWGKSTAAGATAAPYTLIADPRGVFASIAAGVPSSPAYTAQSLVYIGDTNSWAPEGDVWNGVVTGDVNDNIGGWTLAGCFAAGGVPAYMAGSLGGASKGLAVQTLNQADNQFSGAMTGAGADTIGPGFDGVVKTSPLVWRGSGPEQWRSQQPGLRVLFVDAAAALLPANGTARIAGHTHILLPCASSPYGTEGRVAIDIEGPWR